MAVGSTISTIFDDFSIFVDDHFFAPATLMIVIAICLMIVAVTGCVGALKESTMLVNVVSKSRRANDLPRDACHLSHKFISSSLPPFQFALLLFVVFSMELAAAILAYMMHGQVELMLIRTMNESFMMYTKKTYVADGIDFLQTNVSGIAE